MSRWLWAPAIFSLLFLVSVCTPANPQSLPSQPFDALNAEAMKLYSNAHPYIDESSSELKKDVHELAGLQAASSQDSLAPLLAKVGAEADDLLQKVPDVISRETVSNSQWPAGIGSIPGCVGSGCLGPGGVAQRDETFEYLILTRPDGSGRRTVQEFRTGRHGKPIAGVAGAPSFQGFVSTWVIFSSANQVESRFRYLGEQKRDGHAMFVIGFAQIPGSVENPGRIVATPDTIPMFLQGIAWIDQNDFRIVRLHTDLLAAQPEVQIQKQASDILFGRVKMAGRELWLPQEASLEMEARGQSLHEKHTYSGYRLYQATSRIVVPDGN